MAEDGMGRLEGRRKRGAGGALAFIRDGSRWSVGKRNDDKEVRLERE